MAVHEHLERVEAGYPLRRLLAYTHRASRANYNGARESLATRGAAYEDALTLLPTGLVNCSGAKRRMNAARSRPTLGLGAHRQVG